MPNMRIHRRFVMDTVVAMAQVTCVKGIITPIAEMIYDENNPLK